MGEERLYCPVRATDYFKEDDLSIWKAANPHLDINKWIGEPDDLNKDLDHAKEVLRMEGLKKIMREKGVNI